RVRSRTATLLNYTSTREREDSRRDPGRHRRRGTALRPAPRRPPLVRRGRGRGLGAIGGKALRGGVRLAAGGRAAGEGREPSGHELRGPLPLAAALLGPRLLGGGR